MTNLTDPLYDSADVLKITGLRKATLQTWVNRGVIKLTDQNPGRGKSRRYSAIDIVKLSVLRRTDDLNIALSVARDWAEGAANILLKFGSIDWNLYVSHQPRKGPPITIIVHPARSELDKYATDTRDPREMRVSDFVEPFEGVFYTRREKRSLIDLEKAGKSLEKYQRTALRKVISSANPNSQSQKFDASPSDNELSELVHAADPNPINPEKRAKLAEQGIHAEPVIIFPVGEIVNGSLAQLRSLKKREEG